MLTQRMVSADPSCQHHGLRQQGFGDDGGYGRVSAGMHCTGAGLGFGALLTLPFSVFFAPRVCVAAPSVCVAAPCVCCRSTVQRLSCASAVGFSDQGDEGGAIKVEQLWCAIAVRREQRTKAERGVAAFEGGRTTRSVETRSARRAHEQQRLS